MKVKLLLILFACLMELLLLRLGFWQLDRANEKQQHITQMQKSLTSKNATNLAQIRSPSWQFEWAKGYVFFLDKPIILLDNQRKEQQVGVTVYQLARNQNQQIMLVDLGWLPVSSDRTFPKIKALSGEYKVAGLIMPAPAPGIILGQATSKLDENTLLLTRLDIGELSKLLALPLVSRVFRLDPALAIGFERTLKVSSNTLTPEKHRAYAFQWFGLALAFLCLSVYVGKGKRKK